MRGITTGPRHCNAFASVGYHPKPAQVDQVLCELGCGVTPVLPQVVAVAACERQACEALAQGYTRLAQLIEQAKMINA